MNNRIEFTEQRGGTQSSQIWHDLIVSERVCGWNDSVWLFSQWTMDLLSFILFCTSAGEFIWLLWILFF